MSLGYDRDILYEQRLLRESQEGLARLQSAIEDHDGNENPKTFCVDFDGVLHHHETGASLDKFNEPLPPGMAMAKRIKAAGHRLVILTARPKEQHTTIEGWLKGHGVRPDLVTNEKPPAEVYVDDRAVEWPQNHGAPKTREAGVKGMKWGVTSKQMSKVLKKHGVPHNLAPASEKDFYQQGGTASPSKGSVLHIYGDGSWTHDSAKTWRGRRGTLPEELGHGSNADDLDRHLTKLLSSKESRRDKISSFGENGGDGSDRYGLDGKRFKTYVGSANK